MSVLKANGVLSDPTARADWLAQAQQAATSFNSKPNREVTVTGSDATGSLRLKALLTTDQEARRTYRIVEQNMIDHNVQPGSWILAAADDGTVLLQRQWN